MRVALPPIDPAAFARRAAGARVVRLTGDTMGTGWSAQVVVPDGSGALAGAVRTTLAQMIAALSQWEPTSALSRFNRSAIGVWQDIPEALMTVLSTALRVRDASGGAFDPAAGALADLWGFGPPGPRRDVPSATEIANALTQTGGDAIELDGRRARRMRDVRLDLSGIGKGYAVDALAATCRALGCQDFLVEIGGEFVGAGVQPNGQPWWVDIEAPPGLSPLPLRIAAHGVGIATTGDYRRYLTDGTRRLSHTIDPRTGWPVDTGVVSVTVVAADCMTADVWATALTVLGREAGMALAEREKLAMRMLLDDGTELLSDGLRAML